MTEGQQSMRQWWALGWGCLVSLYFASLLVLTVVLKVPPREANDLTRFMFGAIVFPSQYVLLGLRPLGRDYAMALLGAGEPLGIPWEVVFGGLSAGIGAAFWIGVIPSVIAVA